MINENIAYAKSILNKNGITQDSKEYADYLIIREICGNNNNNNSWQKILIIHYQ